MDHIIFTCPNCSQQLEAFPSMTGQLVDCPECSNQVEVPENTQKIQTQIMEDDLEKSKANQKPADSDPNGKKNNG